MRLTLSNILEELLTKYGLAPNPRYDTHSNRSAKHYMKVEAWTTPLSEALHKEGRPIEVFIYEDNTIGLRTGGGGEVEKDIVGIMRREFSEELEAWLIEKTNG